MLFVNSEWTEIVKNSQQRTQQNIDSVNDVETKVKVKVTEANSAASPPRLCTAAKAIIHDVTVGRPLGHNQTEAKQGIWSGSFICGEC